MYIVYSEAMLAKKISTYRKFVLKLTLLLTVIFAVIEIKSYLLAKVILGNHAVIQAHVTGVKALPKEDKFASLTRQNYQISYTFNINKQEYTSSFYTNVDQSSHYKQIGQITIAYSRDNPNKFDRLELLQKQSDPRQLARRIALVFVSIYLFFSIFIWIAKLRLKKNVGQPMEVDHF